MAANTLMFSYTMTAQLEYINVTYYAQNYISRSLASCVEYNHTDYR